MPVWAHQHGFTDFKSYNLQIMSPINPSGKRRKGLKPAFLRVWITKFVIPSVHTGALLPRTQVLIKPE